MRKSSIALLVLCAVATSACSMNARETRALQGGAIGAAGGAVVGALTGSWAVGALVGGAGGAAVGALTSDR
jgi:osmotically inducible lipoprotein OsmB